MISLPLELTAAPWFFDVVTHLWQSTVVALVILLLMAVARRLAARTRQVLGWIAVAKFALPAAWLTQLMERVGGAPPPWFAPEALIVPVTMIPNTAVVANPSAGLLIVTLVAVWSGGAVGLIACWIIRALRLRRQIFAQATSAPEALARQVARAAVRAGLAAAPPCVIVASTNGPGLVGILSPRLILP